MNSEQIVSFLHHRATELFDSSAYETLGDILSSANLPPATEHSAPFHPDAVHLIPEPPSFLIEDLPNFTLAIEYYSKAAEFGSIEASKKAAILIKEGKAHKDESSIQDSQIENDQNHEVKATEMMENAVRENDVNAIRILASWKWENQQETKLENAKNPEKQDSSHAKSRKKRREAFKLWIKAAKLGDVQSAHAVSRCYVVGDGINGLPNNDRALLWQEKAAQMDDTIAIINSAAGFRQKMLDGPHAMDQDVVNASDPLNTEEEETLQSLSFDEVVYKSLFWTQKAADLGDASSLCCLAQTYSQLSSAWDGWKLTYDPRLGIQYYLQAHDSGNSVGLVAAISVLFELWTEECHARLRKRRQLLKSKQTSATTSTGKESKKANSIMKPKELQEFSESVHLSSSHVRDIVRHLNQVMKENDLKGVRIRFTGHSQDIFKLFMKIEEAMGMGGCNEINAEESCSDSD